MPGAGLPCWKDSPRPAQDPPQRNLAPAGIGESAISSKKSRYIVNRDLSDLVFSVSLRLHRRLDGIAASPGQRCDTTRAECGVMDGDTFDRAAEETIQFVCHLIAAAVL